MVSARKRLATLVALPALLAAVLCLLRAVAVGIATGSPYVLALDDPYIHFAVARQFGRTGAFSLDPFEAAAPSSSPFWLLSLVPASLSGILWLPVVQVVLVNTAGAAFAMRVLWSLLRQAAVPVRRRLPVLMLIALFLPLIPLESTGMEHVWHVALCLWIADRHGTWMRLGRRRALWEALAAAFLAAGLRFETAFFLVGFGLVALVRRDVRGVAGLAVASALGACAALAITRMGSDAWVPSSILAKTASGTEGLVDRLREGWDRLAGHRFHAPLALANALALAWGMGLHGAARARVAQWPATYLAAVALHALLARFGWMERYDAYLVAPGLLGIIAAFQCMEGRRGSAARGWAFRVAGGALCGGIAWFGFVKAWAHLWSVGLALSMVGQHQRAAELVLANPHMAEAPIAVTDLGLIAWITDAPMADLEGLTSPELLRAKLSADRNDVTRRILRERGVRYAIIHDALVPEPIRAGWKREAVWVEDTVFGGMDPVTVLYELPGPWEP
jgi:hypothetical protein